MNATRCVRTTGRLLDGQSHIHDHCYCRRRGRRLRLLVLGREVGQRPLALQVEPHEAREPRRRAAHVAQAAYLEGACAADIRPSLLSQPVTIDHPRLAFWQRPRTSTAFVVWICLFRDRFLVYTHTHTQVAKFLFEFTFWQPWPCRHRCCRHRCFPRQPRRAWRGERPRRG